VLRRAQTAAPNASQRPLKPCLTSQKKEISRMARLFPQPASGKDVALQPDALGRRILPSTKVIL